MTFWTFFLSFLADIDERACFQYEGRQQFFSLNSLPTPKLNTYIC